MKDPVKSTLKEYTESIFIALVLAFLIKSFLFQTFLIPSESMASTLLVGDRLVAGKFSYGVKLPFTDTTLVDVGDPKFGDVVIFEYPPDRSIDYIKRVIGLPGDTVEMKNNVVYINGKKLDEPYVQTDPAATGVMRSFGPLTVDADSYFVMGDNRDHSADSRYWGFVPKSHLKAKAWAIYWSSDDWGRVGRVIQ